MDPQPLAAELHSWQLFVTGTLQLLRHGTNAVLLPQPPSHQLHNFRTPYLSRPASPGHGHGLPGRSPTLATMEKAEIRPLEKGQGLLKGRGRRLTSKPRPRLTNEWNGHQSLLFCKECVSRINAVWMESNKKGTGTRFVKFDAIRAGGKVIERSTS